MLNLFMNLANIMTKAVLEKFKAYSVGDFGDGKYGE